MDEGRNTRCPTHWASLAKVAILGPSFDMTARVA
jgi:hypothetical protein